MAEYFDELLENGMPTGKTINRDIAHKEGVWHRSAHVWVITPKKEILFQKRSLLKQTFPGFWDVSAAGHLSAGDTSKGAAIRELYEEIGLECNESSLVFFATTIQQYCNKEINVDDREFSDIYAIECTKSLSDFVLQQEEVSELKFVSLNEFESISKSCPPWFVPHEEEYRIVFDFLKSR